MKRPNIKCPYCGSQAFLRPASVLGKSGPTYDGKQFYVCARYPRCNAYVAAHEHSRLPMGTLASPRLRRLRHDTHLAFDRLWQDGYISIDEAYPIFQLNTEGEDHACVFLKDGRCSVYEARPQVCRMYPFGAEPGERGRDFNYYLCTEQPHHFTDRSVKVKDWLGANFSKASREFLKAHYQALPVLGKAIRSLGEQGYKRLMFKILYYLYFGYDLEKPFLPQYQANIAALMDTIAGATQEEEPICTP